jgi:hypothetical protein
MNRAMQWDKIGMLFLLTFLVTEVDIGDLMGASLELLGQGGRIVRKRWVTEQ